MSVGDPLLSLLLTTPTLTQSQSICPTVSRLAGMDQAIHKTTVGHYTLDVKVSQLLDRLSRVDGKTIISTASFYFSSASDAFAQNFWFFFTTLFNF